MKIAILILLAFLQTASAKSVCSYIYNCASCVIEKSDPPLTIKTSDTQCFEKLREDQSFTPSIERNRIEIDKSPLAMPNQGYSNLTASVLAQSIDRAYKDYQARQAMKKFYEDLPHILENQHKELMDELAEDDHQRKKSKENTLNSIKSTVQELTGSISKFNTPERKNGNNPNPGPSPFDNLGLAEQLQNLEAQVKTQNLSKGFPNITGKDIPDNGQRERSRNSKIQDTSIRKQHSELMDAAETFRKNLALDIAKEVENEARGLRNGKAQGPLTSKIENFKLTQSYLSERREELQDKINSEDSTNHRKKLETINQLAGTLGETGSKSFYSGELDEGQHWTDIAIQVTDIGLGFIPVISTGRDFIEAITGENVVTGEKLEIWERSLCVVSAATLGAGTIAKNTLKILDSASSALVLANKLDEAVVLPKALVKSDISIFRKGIDKVWKSGEELNEAFRLEIGKSVDEFIPPWSRYRGVLEFTTTEDLIMFRVFSSDQLIITEADAAIMSGKWFMKTDPRKILNTSGEVDIDRIKKLYRIPDKNDMSKLVTIKIPAGQRIRVGTVAKTEDGLQGGAIQYFFDSTIDNSWIQNIISLERK